MSLSLLCMQIPRTTTATTHLSPFVRRKVAAKESIVHLGYAAPYDDPDESSENALCRSLVFE